MKSEYDFSRASVGKFYREGASVRLPDGGSDQRPDDRRTPQFDKLLALLKELFQLDRPDLDFGFYRIMHAKSAEITKFLEQDLLPQVREALSQYQSADRAVLERELADALRSAEALGVNPDDSTTVKDLRARLDHAVDVNTLEAEVYDHLYGFFRRYYSDGDFISKRVYKPGVYAIPYEGEEVKLHWANADQYYIKTDEYLRDYAFRLRPGESDPMRVRFQLVAATEGEHGTLKPSAAKKRVFMLRATDFIAEQDGEQGKELVLNFEYRPATLADWPDEQRNQKKRPPAQNDLLAQAENRLRQTKGRPFARWLQVLGQPHIAADGNQAGYSRFRLHLNRYTARHTFDYFIHKDLGGFLRRELDFYINNEVMHLGDVEHAAALQVEQHLSRIKVVRRIGTKIIDFLAQLEDFQKALWLKKKFVVETSYCIRLGCIPKAFHAEIVANDGQRNEWLTLFGAENLRGDLLTINKGTAIDVLSSNPNLMVDTRHYNTDFTSRLLDALSANDLDDCLDGVLVHGDNWHALSLLTARYRKQIDCVYIDPPYNTGDSEIVYKNGYLRSSWLTLMANRLELLRSLFAQDPMLYIAIDDFEMVNLAKLVDTKMPGLRREMIIVNHHPQGGKSKTLAHTHEYMLACLPVSSDRTLTRRMSDNGAELRPFKRSGTADSNFRHARPNSFYAILIHPVSRTVVGLESPPEGSEYPTGRTENGLVRVYPIGAKGEERVWRRSYESCKKLVVNAQLQCSDRNVVYQVIEAEDRRAALFSNWTDQRYNSGTHGANLLRHIIGVQNPFPYPKSIHTVTDAILVANLDDDACVLDYFAGSGTTGHAVINLNREDGGERKFILVEMGDHFDTVLVPRIKKIVFSPEWKDGRPNRASTLKEKERSPRIVKIVRLESYEDTINNLIQPQTPIRGGTLGIFEDENAKGLREQYVLNYMLDVETHGNPSRLNVTSFADPTSYRLKVKQLGSDESREVNVDLLETFNWLTGLAAHHIADARAFEANVARDPEGRLRIAGDLKEQARAPWWFRTVTGTMPDGRRVLVIWRKRPGGESPDGIERDNLVLDEWFKLERSFRDAGAYDLVYVNGSNNLENLKSPSDTWTVRLIEDDFHRLMWEQ